MVYDFVVRAIDKQIVITNDSDAVGDGKRALRVDVLQVCPVVTNWSWFQGVAAKMT